MTKKKAIDSQETKHTDANDLSMTNFYTPKSMFSCATLLI